MSILLQVVSQDAEIMTDLHVYFLHIESIIGALCYIDV